MDLKPCLQRNGELSGWETFQLVGQPTANFVAIGVDFFSVLSNSDDLPLQSSKDSGLFTPVALHI